MKKKTKFDDFIRRYAVVFLHSKGWTISTVHSMQLDAMTEMGKNKQLLPDFKYKVVKLEPVSFYV